MRGGVNLKSAIWESVIFDLGIGESGNLESIWQSGIYLGIWNLSGIGESRIANLETKPTRKVSFADSRFTFSDRGTDYRFPD